VQHRKRPRLPRPCPPVPAPRPAGPSPILADLRARIEAAGPDGPMCQWLLKLLEGGERAASAR
jgi:hypothetical protein